MNKFKNQNSTFNGINFKSKLEISCYKKLIEAGFNPEYEKQKICFI